MTTITPTVLANVVFVRGAVYYQPPVGAKMLLVSADELDEHRMTQQAWVSEQMRRLNEEDE